MLNVGLGNAVFAQPDYRHRNSSYERRYVSRRWQAEHIVRQAYLDILRREPDPSGMHEYTDAILRRGWSAADVRRSLATSREYAYRFGRRGRWGRDDWRRDDGQRDDWRRDDRRYR
jgi:hypothetical protein